MSHASVKMRIVAPADLRVCPRPLREALGASFAPLLVEVTDGRAYNLNGSLREENRESIATPADVIKEKAHRLVPAGLLFNAPPGSAQAYRHERRRLAARLYAQEDGSAAIRLGGTDRGGQIGLRRYVLAVGGQ